MIGGIRRRLGQSSDSETWDADLELEPEVEDASELPTDTAVILAAARVTPGFAPSDSSAEDYYKSIVRTAIENGGKYGDHTIAIPWLRMILAGLESRHIDPEMMWYGMEEVGSSEVPLPEAPTYSDLFPSERDPPTGPGPR